MKSLSLMAACLCNKMAEVLIYKVNGCYSAILDQWNLRYLEPLEPLVASQPWALGFLKNIIDSLFSAPKYYLIFHMKVVATNWI